MPTATEITVSLGWDGRRVRQVGIRARRDFSPAALLAGREPREASALLPRLFSVCAEAQGAAATAACSAVTDEPMDHAARARAVRLETVHEHLWRLLIDWPRAAGEEPAYAAFAPARTALADARGAHAEAAARALDVARDVACAAVFGEPPARWLAQREPGELLAWSTRSATVPARLLGILAREHRGLGRSQVGLMPAGDEALASALAGIAAAQDRGAHPAWAGHPAETGALARMQAHPLLAALRASEGDCAAVRMTARLAELAHLLTAEAHDDAATVQSIRMTGDEGAGAVQTARGLLLHRVRLEAGRIAGYRILAPTDWNFAPDGPLAAGLLGAEAPTRAELEARARLAVLALDPCVACRVEIGHA